MGSSAESEATKIWNERLCTATSIVTKQKAHIWANSSFQARDEISEKAVVAPCDAMGNCSRELPGPRTNTYHQNTHTAEVIIVTLATEEALMNELLPWLKWLESKGVHPCSMEVPLNAPAIPVAGVESHPSPQEAVRKAGENASDAELDLFRSGPYSDWGINE